METNGKSKHNNLERLTKQASIHQAGTNNPYIHLATSDNTRRAYRSDIQHYYDWGGKLPATPDMIATYLQHFAEKLNPRTLSRRLIAIKHWHQYQNFADPTTHPAIKKTIAGILRAHGKPKVKARSLTIDELVVIHKHLINVNSFTALRDDAMLLIGFFGAFRRSELVAIHYEHIRWDKAGIEILIPSSKTDPDHEGQYCAIPYGKKVLCPIRSLNSWLDHASITSGPIFSRITKDKNIGDKPLHPYSVNIILRNRASEVKLDNIEMLSGHSLRRGLATCAAEAGAPLHAIMRSGRWKQTDTVIEYIEANDRFSESASIKVLSKLE